MDPEKKGEFNVSESPAMAGGEPKYFDAETANIGGEIPLHPHPKGPNESINDLKEELEDEEEIDWYKPFPIVPGIQEERSILTTRAVLVGCVLGSLVNCSNVYLGM